MVYQHNSCIQLPILESAWPSGSLSKPSLSLLLDSAAACCSEAVLLTPAMSMSLSYKIKVFLVENFRSTVWSVHSTDLVRKSVLLVEIVCYLWFFNITFNDIYHRFSNKGASPNKGAPCFLRGTQPQIFMFLAISQPNMVRILFCKKPLKAENALYLVIPLLPCPGPLLENLRYIHVNLDIVNLKETFEWSIFVKSIAFPCIFYHLELNYSEQNYKRVW